MKMRKKARMNFTKTTLKTSLLIVTGMTTMVHPSRAANIRVPQDYPTIQSAVNSANAADTIFVSAGTYNEFNIQITNNVSISSLNGPTNTIIDMQHNGRGFIVTGATLTNVSIIGFAIQNAQIPYRDGVGAINVVSGKCRISRCIIQGTSGAADYSGVTIGNQNTNVDDVLVENCIIHKNFAANNVGIAAPAVFNCWVYGNTGGNNCSALSGCNATNCTVYGNGGVFLPNPWTVGGGSQGYWKNCIVWNNLPSYNNQQIYQPVSVSYCIVMGGFPGTGNLSSDPLFVNPASGDFRLQANSPAKGSGDPSIVKADGSRSDIGASGDINDGFPITTPGSLEFNGTNTYVSVDGSFLGGITTNQFTLDGWFRTPEPNRPQYLIQKTENWKEWAFSITQDGGLSFFNAWPFSYYTLDTPLNLVHTNTWHHFALVVSGLDQRIYSTGQLATNAMLNSQVSFHAEIAGTTLAPMVFACWTRRPHLTALFSEARWRISPCLTARWPQMKSHRVTRDVPLARYLEFGTGSRSMKVPETRCRMLSVDWWVLCITDPGRRWHHRKHAVPTRQRPHCSWSTVSSSGRQSQIPVVVTPTPRPF